jgi:hypothetical protein
MRAGSPGRVDQVAVAAVVDSGQRVPAAPADVTGRGGHQCVDAVERGIERCGLDEVTADELDTLCRQPGCVAALADESAYRLAASYELTYHSAAQYPGSTDD